MTITQSIGIEKAVGLGGANRPNDVKIVQTRLNELMPPKRAKLSTSGRCGMATIGAIREFQRIVVGYRFPDSRVDVDDKTIECLNNPMSKQKWATNLMSIAATKLDAKIEIFQRVLESKPKVNLREIENAKQRKELEKLKKEIDRLEITINRKYPDGRPSGLGILAILTPGDYTINGLDWYGDTVDSATKNYGDGAGCLTALFGTIAIPFVLIYGGFADSMITIKDLAVGDPKHGLSTEYDAIRNEVKILRMKIEQADKGKAD